MFSKIYSRIKKTKFEKNVKIGRMTKIINSKIGAMTYIGDKSFLINTNVGRFCSIASNVRVIFGEHPTKKFVSSSPIFYKPKNIFKHRWVNEQKFNEYKFADSNNGIMVDIGNDVWIGYGAKLLNGISIGDGAIIAAGSVVTKNVPHYAIIGGNPAKIIRFRFEQSEIEKLLKLKWWNSDLKTIRYKSDIFENIELFFSGWEG